MAGKTCNLYWILPALENTVALTGQLEIFRFSCHSLFLSLFLFCGHQPRLKDARLWQGPL